MSNAGGVALLVAAGEQEDFRPLFAHPKTGHLLAWVHQEPTFWGGALLLTAEFVSAPGPVARGTLEGPFSSCSPAARRRTMKAASNPLAVRGDGYDSYYERLFEDWQQAVFEPFQPPREILANHSRALTVCFQSSIPPQAWPRRVPWRRPAGHW